MSKGSIPLHKEHGLNPMIEQCHICGADTGSILLLGRNCKEKAPMKGTTPNSVCDTCQETMKAGIMFVETKDGETGKNPYRTGRLWGIKEEAVERFISEPLLSQVKQSRICFIEESTAKQIGFHEAPTP